MSFFNLVKISGLEERFPCQTLGVPGRSVIGSIAGDSANGATPTEELSMLYNLYLTILGKMRESNSYCI